LLFEHRRRRTRNRQNAVAMLILRNGVNDGPAAEVTRDHGREFVRQWQASLENAGLPVESLERGQRFLMGSHARLPLAVVTKPRSLEDAGEQMRGRLLEVMP